VPKFYFHVHDDLATFDEDGVELPDFEAVRRVAIKGARELACEQLRRGKVTLGHRIEVTDEDQRPVLTVSFGQAFEIEY
jgi:hypothetical protein